MTTDLHPELARLGRVPRFSFRRWALPGVRAAMRLGRIASRLRPPGVEIVEYEEDGAHVRVLRRPDSSPRGALLWIHGGGLILGAPWQDDARCAAWVHALDILVVSAYYRLAPEHPFPAALDDCRAAWSWLQANAGRFGIEPSRIALGGESAGGGLAASLAQRLLDEGAPQPAGQLLVYPMLDDRTAARRELDHPKHLIWNNTSNATGWSCYLAQPPGAASVPAYSVAARRDDLRGLPPAWIGVGRLDLFLDENREYAQRLTQAGVDCELDEVAGAVHGFAAMLPDAPVSRAFDTAQQSFLRKSLRLVPAESL